ncbi:uncharacterized protein zgc:174863 isoform X2 [Ctenopharyngodon idella]|uniref:uncharacterized protein zgc:174863 isoform X2 n=1 Tax=Ctenopharyngodon idella TaxID=7959 RepID=UPI002231506A|nr:uncharacterized protein zgc:174863 isoform X2 [Ctenopharyngodon idella]XP_051753067.1 uncharacterized protein zgc:174863 isoform X2 [Ctenopharyngodon idella]
MASLMVMVFVIVSLFIPAARPSQDLWKLECLPTVGIVSETTVIRCIVKDFKTMEILAVSLTKITQEKPVFEMNQKSISGDERFSLKNPKLGPSLQISDTKFSDEGEYLYRVMTDSGVKMAQFSISITAKYKNPVTSIWPEVVTDGRPINLYCNATDGYPAGFIHWFDRYETNWTMNSELKTDTKDTNGLKSVALYSRLTFKSVNDLEPFRCIVFNSKYAQDGESTLSIKSLSYGDPEKEISASNTTQIVAGVMVIGSLIVGLLFALLIFRKRNGQHGRRPSAHPILSYESGNTEDDLETGNYRVKVPLSADEIENKP